MSEEAQIRAVMSLLGKRRWAGKSEAEKAAHAKMMVTARIRKHKAKPKRTD